MVVFVIVGIPDAQHENGEELGRSPLEEGFAAHANEGSKNADDARESVSDPTGKVLLCFPLPGTVVGALSLLKPAGPLGLFASARSCGIRFGGVRRERQARPMDHRARPGYSGSCVEYRACLTTQPANRCAHVDFHHLVSGPHLGVTVASRRPR